MSSTTLAATPALNVSANAPPSDALHGGQSSARGRGRGNQAQHGQRPRHGTHHGMHHLPMSRGTHHRPGMRLHRTAHRSPCQLALMRQPPDATIASGIQRAGMATTAQPSMRQAVISRRLHTQSAVSSW